MGKVVKVEFSSSKGHSTVAWGLRKFVFDSLSYLYNITSDKNQAMEESEDKDKSKRDGSKAEYYDAYINGYFGQYGIYSCFPGYANPWLVCFCSS